MVRELQIPPYTVENTLWKFKNGFKISKIHFRMHHFHSKTRLKWDSSQFFSQNIFRRCISAFILYLFKLNPYLNETYIRFIKNRSNICFRNKSKKILPETFVLFHWLLFMFAPLNPLPHLSIKDTPNVSFTIFFFNFFMFIQFLVWML